MMFFFRAPPEVEQARIVAKQRAKELAFATTVSQLAVKASRGGLEKKRILRVIAAAATTLQTVGEK
jgi:hypothetical protein